MGIKNSFLIAKSNVLSIFKKLIINRKVLRVCTLLFIPETVNGKTSTSSLISFVPRFAYVKRSTSYFTCFTIAVNEARVREK